MLLILLRLGYDLLGAFEAQGLGSPRDVIQRRFSERFGTSRLPPASPRRRLIVLDLNFAKCEDYQVRIISRKAIKDASERHGEWAASLNAWYRIAKTANWNSFEEIRASWKNSDKVGKFVVFDISHNKCRMICTIKYEWKMVYVRSVLSHAEYDRKDWDKG